ncbi:probable chitinase 2 [Anopheles ziemanni]|uniref:probable chitinase 2 n=1 Tax=Anopheles coustani TaxID=139045 RepID=UPI00265800E1|nr:probable chitinase 2 [Anopheles coustani]XP_058175334.1 probable chitinase 2 [Anopheles ziemanni]
MQLLVSLRIGALLLWSMGVLVAGDLKCAERPYRVVCYLASWANYREGSGSFNISYIVPDHCTHLVYTFAGLNIGGGIDSLDYMNDINVNKGYQRFVSLKEENPCLKVMLAIGGWNEGSEKYSLMAEQESTREAFADQTLRYLIHYGFDGLDLDWEYPTMRGGIPEDRDNFVLLVQTLRKRFSPRKKLLTAAISASKQILAAGYDLPKLCDELDFINLMTYDYASNEKTALDAPLFTDYNSPGETIDSTIAYISKSGCPMRKFSLGITTHAKTYTVVPARLMAPGIKATGPGLPGPYTVSPGSLGYNELCEMLKTNRTTSAPGQPAGSVWTVKAMAQNAVKYAYRDDQWVTFDGVETIGAKVQYAMDKKLGGIMFWTLDTDDFQGDCHNEAYPLLQTALRTLGYVKKP